MEYSLLLSGLTIRILPKNLALLMPLSQLGNFENRLFRGANKFKGSSDPSKLAYNNHKLGEILDKIRVLT